MVAVVGLTEPDDLWTDAERNEPQTYIGRLLVAGDGRGQGYGAAVVEAVADEARQHGDKWLRVNCWSTNTRLHAYYKALGFRHVRTVDVPGRMSGALFERDLTRALVPPM
jgi:GNAT superfamily N-acetyltransferase